MFTFVNVSFSEPKKNIFLSNRLLNNVPKLEEKEPVISQSVNTDTAVMSYMAKNFRELIAGSMLLASSGAVANANNGNTETNGLSEQQSNQLLDEKNTEKIKLEEQLAQLKKEIDELEAMSGNSSMIKGAIDSIKSLYSLISEDPVLARFLGALGFVLFISILTLSLKLRIKTGISEENDKSIFNMIKGLERIPSTLKSLIAHKTPSSGLLNILDKKFNNYIHLLETVYDSMTDNITSLKTKEEYDSLEQDLEITEGIINFSVYLLGILGTVNPKDLKASLAKLDEFNSDFCDKYEIENSEDSDNIKLFLANSNQLTKEICHSFIHIINSTEKGVYKDPDVMTYSLFETIGKIDKKTKEIQKK